MNMPSDESWPDVVRLYARWDQHLMLTPQHPQSECEECLAFAAERKAQIDRDRAA